MIFYIESDGAMFVEKEVLLLVDLMSHSVHLPVTMQALQGNSKVAKMIKNLSKRKEIPKISEKLSEKLEILITKAAAVVNTWKDKISNMASESETQVEGTVDEESSIAKISTVAVDEGNKDSNVDADTDTGSQVDLMMAVESDPVVVDNPITSEIRLDDEFADCHDPHRPHNNTTNTAE